MHCVVIRSTEKSWNKHHAEGIPSPIRGTEKKKYNFIKLVKEKEKTVIIRERKQSNPVLINLTFLALKVRLEEYGIARQECWHGHH
jgi:hypothetical protein